MPLTPSDKIQGLVLVASAQIMEPGAAEFDAVLVALTPYCRRRRQVRYIREKHNFIMVTSSTLTEDDRLMG